MGFALHLELERKFTNKEVEFVKSYDFIKNNIDLKIFTFIREL